MMKVFRILSILVICASICVYAMADETAEKDAIHNVMDTYLNRITGPTVGPMDQVTKDIREFTSLFDFANLKSSDSVPFLYTMADEYNKAKTEGEREAYKIVFAGKFVDGFQKARIDRVGKIAKDDFEIEDITITKNNEEAAAIIRDKKLGILQTFLLHKKDGVWLIYSWEIDSSNQ